MNITKAEASDLDDVATLFDGYRRFYGQPPDPSGCRAFVAARLEAGDSVILLARAEDGAAAGFTQLYPSFSSVRMCRVWILNDLFVAPGSRGRGTATALMQAAADVARENDVAILQLETASDNAAARQLYEKLGWTLESGFDHYSFAL